MFPTGHIEIMISHRYVFQTAGDVTEMVKLTCRVSAELADAVNRYRIEHDVKKSEALRALIELAIDKPDYPISVSKAEEKNNCTIELDDSDFEKYKSYRLQYKLVAKVSFFKHALIRGITIYSSGFGQGDLDL